MEASQLPGGEGARVSFGVGCETVRRRRRRRLFLFWGGRGASQLWSCVVLFCGEARRVSFRGAKGGESALELGVKLFVVAVVAVCFCFGRAGGQSALELGVKLFVVAVVAVCFCFGRAGGQSALELGVKLFVAVAVVVLSVFVLGRAGGQSASGAVKGEGGPVSFGCSSPSPSSCCLFLFWGGTGASQLPGL